MDSGRGRVIVLMFTRHALAAMPALLGATSACCATVVRGKKDCIISKRLGIRREECTKMMMNDSSHTRAVFL